MRSVHRSDFKQLLAFSLTLVLLLCLSAPALAEDDSRSYDFDLKANGEHEVTAKAGDVLTFTLNLKQTSGGSNEIYAFQTEILYDSSCLRLVEKSNITAPGLEAHDVELQNGMHAYYINYVSMVGGEVWEQDTLAGTFQMEVIGGRGKLAVQNTNYSVSTADGNDSFSVSAQDVTILLGSSAARLWYVWLLLILLIIAILLYVDHKIRKHKGKHETQKKH